MNVTIISKSPVYQEVLNILTSVIPGISVVGNFLIGTDTPSLSLGPKTDVLIMDCGKEEDSDFNFLKMITKKFRNTSVLVVSRGNHPGLRESLRSSGVDGCIERFSLDSDLEPAIQKIQQGEMFFN